MRRRLAVLVAATTSVVLLAFLLPLAVLVSRTARDDALGEATRQSQAVVAFVATGTPQQVDEALTQVSTADVRTAVRLPDGTLLGSLPAGVDTVAVPRSTTVTREDGDAVVRQPVFREDGSAVVVTRVTGERLREGVGRAWLVLGLLGVSLVVMSLLVADRLARSITAPITDLARTAERLAGGDLDARVRPAGPDEVREVGQALNQLAGRIRQLLSSEREAVADLSHRLRTPITALRLDAESLADPQDRARLTGDVDELTRQVDALIQEARRPVREGVAARCDARVVVADRVDFWSVLAEEQGRPVHLDLPAGPCPVRASGGDLEAALDALLGNVIAHTPEGCGLSVSVAARPDGDVLVVVSDEGPGFADAAVLGRGESRAGSTGLGLDIARRTAAASGGEVRLGAAPGGGARVAMRLGPPDG